MGLIKAVLGSTGGVLADQWKEYFYCESIDKDILAVKGQKVSGSRTSNTKGSDNVISNGSGIVVADGQCMMIVDQGKVVELCAEPGQYTYDKSSEPSIFTGKLGTAIKESFKTIGRRIAYGGDTGKDQRVYYFNIKEIVDNKFGTANPVPFRVVDSKIGLDLDVSIRCSGVYSYRIADPMKFYVNLCGNFSSEYGRSNIDSQLKTEFLSALQPAFGKLSDMEMRPNQIVNHTTDLENAMNEVLSSKWEERGLKVATVAIGTLTIPDDQMEEIRNAQKAGMYRDPGLAAGNLSSAQADAMRDAARNTSGAATGFMGMGMAMNGNGMNLQNLYAMQQQQQQMQAQLNQMNVSRQAQKTDEKKTIWKCSCGAENTGKFCIECGTKKPEDGWKCSCGAVNKGKFCSECGAKKPAGAALYKCDKCGWEPEDPNNPPKFCPECGDIFDDKDIR